MSATGFAAVQYHQDTWNIDDGLPVNVINAVLQDRTGYLWLATNDGLARFDGIRFTVFNTVTHPQMQSNRILDLAEAADGSLWWNTEQSHLVSLRKGEFKHQTERDGLPDRTVYRIRKDDHGVLWFGTGNGIVRFDGERLQALDPAVVNGKIEWFHARANGEVWYRREDDLGIYRYRNGRAEHMLQAEQSAEGNEMLELASGAFLIATVGRMWKHDGDTFESMSNGLPPDTIVTELHQDADGVIRAMTQHSGTLAWTGRHWEKHLIGSRRAQDGQAMLEYGHGHLWVISDHRVYRDGELVLESPEKISAAFQDNEGNLWLSRVRSGLNRLRPSLFRTWGPAEGLPEPNVYPVLIADDGAVWAGTFGGGPVRIVDNAVESDFDYPDSIEAFFTYSMVQRGGGEIVAAIDHDIVRFHAERRRFEHFRPAIDVYIDEYYALFEDSRRRLWAGTNQGVFVLEDEAWHAVLDDDRSRANYIRYFAEAPDGSLWMASNGQGILRWKDGDVFRIDRSTGLVSNNIRALLVDENDHGYILWVGSEDRGLQRLEIPAGSHRPESFTTIQESDGLFDNVIHVILPDARGRLWMNTNRGIFWVEKRELEDFASGRIDTIRPVYYDRRDGLRNREGNGGMQSAGAVAADGSLWFPTQAGVVQVDPASISRNQRPARPVIESVAFGESMYTHHGGDLNLDQDNRDFRIRYTGLSWQVPGKVNFRYKLKGFDDDWHLTGQREAAYTNIPAGEYSFMLEAVNNDGVWSDAPATLTISIAPRFHETAWFYALMALALALGVYGLISWRTHQIRQRQRELEGLVTARTRELVEEKELTEQQARQLRKLDEAKTRFFTNISHELRTPLTLIMGPIREFLGKKQISRKDRDGHEMALRNSRYLLRLINQILDLSKLEAGEIQLQPRRADFAGFVRDVVDLFRPVCEQQEIELAVSCEAAAIELVFDAERMEQVVANLVSNAIKFTLSGGTVQVDVREDGQHVELTVEDSGIGIAADEHDLVFQRFYQADTSETQAGEGTGVGLSLVKNLVELHGGEIILQSEPGRGSRFIVTLDRRALDQARIIESGAPAVAPALPVEAARENEAPFGQANPDRPSILIADDNRDMRAFVRRVLGDRYHLIEAADGDEALRFCRETLPDLVILDVMMPGMDGFSVGRALQEDQTLHGIPMVFLTAKGGREDRLEGFESGAVAYLTKPFEPEFLKIQIGNLVEQQMRIREKLRQDTPAVPVPTDPFEVKLTKVLSRKFMNADFGVIELAEAMNLDRSQLFRRIKDCSGVSASKYIQKFRLSQAARLLASGQSGSVSQVAYGCGFNNLSWFSKCFREQFGVPPGEYA